MEWERSQKHGYCIVRGDKREVWCGGRDCCGGGPVGERRALIGSARLPPSSGFLPRKSENRNGNCEQGYKGKLIMKKSRLSG